MIAIDDHLTFSEVTHTYFLDGLEVFGVTSVLDAVGITDFSRVPADISDRAKTFGRCVHKATHLFDDGILDHTSLDPLLVPYLEAWKAFKDEYLSEIVESEKGVYSLKFGFAGTLDRIAYDKQGDLCLIDIKSSTKMTVATALQTAAYRQAYHEMSPKNRVKRRIGVQLRENGFTLHEYKDGSDFDSFLNCLHVANFKKKWKLA